jgi:hypothetical protein
MRPDEESIADGDGLATNTIGTVLAGGYCAFVIPVVRREHAVRQVQLLNQYSTRT